MKYALTDTVLISEVSISGLSRTNTKSIEARMGLNTNTYYSADELNQAVRNAFGTRSYERIRYSFVPTADGKTNLQINATENSGVFLKAAIHFNSFTGGALVLNATAKNVLLPRSRMIFKANLGRDPKFKLAYHKFFGRRDEYGFGATANYDSYNMPIYDDYDQSAEYRYKEWWFDATLHKYFKTSSLYLGYSVLSPNIIPKITDAVKLEGRNRYMNLKAGIYLNSLDRPNFATKGWHVKGEFAYYFNQKPDVKLYYDDDLIIDLGSSDFDFDTYERLFIKAYSHTSVSPRSVITGGYHLGLQFDYKESFLNQFVVGGLTDFLRSQIPFAGLDHASKNTESIGVLQAGWQYEISHNLYSTVKANAGVYDFSSIENASELTATKNLLTGYAVTAGYSSPIGPLELSLMYSDQSETFMGYLNLGFHF
jgi:NTE family protein